MTNNISEMDSVHTENIRKSLGLPNPWYCMVVTWSRGVVMLVLYNGGMC